MARAVLALQVRRAPLCRWPTVARETPAAIARPRILTPLYSMYWCSISGLLSRKSSLQSVRITNTPNVDDPLVLRKSLEDVDAFVYTDGGADGAN